MTLKQSTSLCVVLAMVLLAAPLQGGSPAAADKPLPMVVVEATYPGSNAEVLADTVAAPIEQQVRGVENAVHLMSRCSHDGKYTLAVSFKPGIDLNAAQRQVQNRVNLALPGLPEVVKQLGVSITRKTPVLMMVFLSSPKDRYDTFYVSNYATLQIKDELARLRGVGAISSFGLRDYSLRVWLDPKKLAARNLVAGDVVKALQEQNVQVAAGQIGQPPAGKKQDDKIDLKNLGRLAEPTDLEDIVLKTDGAGAKVRITDVGHVELGAYPTESHALYRSKPGVALAIHPAGETRLKELSRAVEERLAQLRDRLPKGLQLDVAFDFTANLEAAKQPTAREHLLLDVQLPDSSSMERMVKVLKRGEKLVGDMGGVEDVLALTENPFDLMHHQPCILVRLAPQDQRKVSRSEIAEAIRAKLEKESDVQLRVRDLARAGSLPRCGYPINLAISGPEADKVRDLAKMLGERLQDSAKLTDVWVNRESVARPAGLSVDVDRAKATAKGLALHDVFTTLQVSLGSLYVNDFNRFGRTWQVVVQTEGKHAKRAVEDLERLKVRNKNGDMIALASVATVRATQAPRAVHRLDLQAMVQITANPAADAPLQETRALCETLLDGARRKLQLSADYRLSWLDIAVAR